MATVYSDFYRTGLGATPKHHKTGPIISATYALTANPTANDIITMLQIPAGFKVVDGWMIATDLDTNATETIELDIGISGDTTKFLNSGVLNGDVITNFSTVASIRLPFETTDLPYTPTSATDLIVTVVAAAATFAAGTLSVYVIGEFLPPT